MPGPGFGTWQASFSGPQQGASRRSVRCGQPCGHPPEANSPALAQGLAWAWCWAFFGGNIPWEGRRLSPPAGPHPLCLPPSLPASGALPRPRSSFSSSSFGSSSFPSQILGRAKPSPSPPPFFFPFKNQLPVLLSSCHPSSPPSPLLLLPPSSAALCSRLLPRPGSSCVFRQAESSDRRSPGSPHWPCQHLLAWLPPVSNSIKPSESFLICLCCINQIFSHLVFFH